MDDLRAELLVRLDPALAVEGTLRGRFRREGAELLVFRQGREEAGRVSGDPERLDLLVEILETEAPDDARAVPLPKALAAFERLAEERATLVRALLGEGREKVERVERLVCALYGLPQDLTEDVVRHAVERAAR
ncbi:MAG: hypothetical protein RMM28_11230 [Thermoleophilia bacterium]|nr:hypothetical protein [Gaiellaceae bacterium]MDW8339699.1 hypothetical protein [Thermoleophilia bacterium]